MARAPNLAAPLERTQSSTLLTFAVRIGGSALMVTGLTLVMHFAAKVVDAHNLEILYILPVLTAAVLWGLVYALGVSIASALTFDYFFIRRTDAFTASLSDIIGLAVFIVSALVVSELANRAHIRARVSEQAHNLIAEEQSALRRVATLVAREVSTSEVIEAVAAEVGKLMEATSAYVARFDSDGRTTIVSSWHREGSDHGLVVGARYEIDDDTVSGRVYKTGRAERIDYAAETLGSGALSADLTRMRIRSSIGAPIIVGGRIWGAIMAVTAGEPGFAAQASNRLADFTELVSTAISNSDARSELEASRSRIVAAGDAERRRIERDIHDGAQQRLVALALDLRATEMSLPPEDAEARRQIDRVARELGSVLDELRTLSRGIHPSLLTDRGLKAALRSLARRSPVPVEVDVAVDERYAEAVEVAVYYVASEALVNASKHAQASVVHIELRATDDLLSLLVSDDGLGGADPNRGTGLVGLADRVGALGGRCSLSSPLGSGTVLSVELPIEPRVAVALTVG